MARNNLDLGKRSVGLIRRLGAFLFNKLLGLVIMVIVLIFMAGVFRWSHSHSGFLTNGKGEDLNEIINMKDEIPIGQFVTLNASAVLDTFASRSSTISTDTLSLLDLKWASGTDYYYLVMLDDYTLMAVRVADEQDIEALNSQRYRFWVTLEYMNLSEYFVSDARSSCAITGKLEEMRDKETIVFYEKAMKKYGFTPGDNNVRYLILDATEWRVSNVIVFIVLPVCALIVLFKIRSKKKKQQAQQTSPT